MFRCYTLDALKVNINHRPEEGFWSSQPEYDRSNNELLDECQHCPYKDHALTGQPTAFVHPITGQPNRNQTNKTKREKRKTEAIEKTIYINTGRNRAFYLMFKSYLPSRPNMLSDGPVQERTFLSFVWGLKVWYFTLKGVVHFKKKFFIDNLLTLMSSKMPMSFFLRSKIN